MLLSGTYKNKNKQKTNKRKQSIININCFFVVVLSKSQKAIMTLHSKTVLGKSSFKFFYTRFKNEEIKSRAENKNGAAFDIQKLSLSLGHL